MGSLAKAAVSLLDGPSDGVVHSALRGPIESLSFLRRSLLFAELSNLSYMSRAQAGRLSFQIGLPEIRFYEIHYDGTAAATQTVKKE